MNAPKIFFPDGFYALLCLALSMAEVRAKVWTPLEAPAALQEQAYIRESFPVPPGLAGVLQHLLLRYLDCGDLCKAAEPPSRGLERLSFRFYPNFCCTSQVSLPNLHSILGRA